MESPSANAVALQGSVNLNVKRHSPVATSQSFALLSAEAVNSREESTAEQILAVRRQACRKITLY